MIATINKTKTNVLIASVTLWSETYLIGGMLRYINISTISDHIVHAIGMNFLVYSFRDIGKLNVSCVIISSFMQNLAGLGKISSSVIRIVFFEIYTKGCINEAVVGFRSM